MFDDYENQLRVRLGLNATSTTPPQEAPEAPVSPQEGYGVPEAPFGSTMAPDAPQSEDDLMADAILGWQNSPLGGHVDGLMRATAKLRKAVEMGQLSPDEAQAQLQELFNDAMGQASQEAETPTGVGAIGNSLHELMRQYANEAEEAGAVDNSAAMETDSIMEGVR